MSLEFFEGDTKLLFGELTRDVIGVFYEVYNELGFGFLEAVYSEAMWLALKDRGIKASREVDVPVHFRNRRIGNYKADMVVEDKLLIEPKVSRLLSQVHQAQLFHYLRATRFEIGLLFNFGPKPEFKRIAFSNLRKGPQEMFVVSHGGAL